MSDPRRNRKRRQARGVRGRAQEQPIGFSAREVALQAAGAVARLALVRQGCPLQTEDITRRHLAFAGEVARRMQRLESRRQIGQCIHVEGAGPAFYWTPSRPNVVLCPDCLARTPRPHSCDRCRRSDGTTLRRWFAAGAAPDGGTITGLIIVAFTCERCEADLAVRDDEAPEGAP